jgi:hypothetical protein
MDRAYDAGTTLTFRRGYTTERVTGPDKTSLIEGLTTNWEMVACRGKSDTG